MSTKKRKERWKPRLPEEVSNILTDLRDNKDYRLGGYLVVLRSKGWSLATLAKPIGITRERVRQLAELDPIGTALEELNCGAWGFPVPEVPTKPEVIKVKRTVIEPDPEVVARLQTLQPYARSVRGKNPKYRKEGEEYSRLVAGEVSRGVSTNRLAKTIGVTNSALRFRLVRYGYAQSTGTTKSYRPIAPENRVTL